WETIVRRPSAPPDSRAVWIGMLLFVAAYFASALVPGGPVARAIVLLALAGAIWWIADRTPLGIALAAGTAIIGTGVESTLIHAGSFVYTRPDYLGVAGWLPCLYLCAQPAVGALGKRLVS